MGILLSKLPEQETIESSGSTSHGYVNRPWPTNQKRKKRGRGVDVPDKSRKRSKSSHDADTFNQNAKSSHKDVQSIPRGLVASHTTNSERSHPAITKLDSFSMSSSDELQTVARKSKSRRREKRSTENENDIQLIQSNSRIEIQGESEQEKSSVMHTMPKKPRRKRKAPTSPHFLETPTSPDQREKPSKKKSKTSVIEAGPMPASLPHFRPTSPDEFGLIQEKLRHDPWRMLVAVIFLNVTTAKMALPLLSQLFERWPSPEALSKGTLPTVSGYLI